MIIDSDDEKPPAQAAAFVDEPEFEEAAPDARGAYPDIVQRLDLALGTEGFCT